MEQIIIINELGEPVEISGKDVEDHCFTMDKFQQERSLNFEGDQHEKLLSLNSVSLSSTPTPTLKKSGDNEYTYWLKQVALKLIDEYKNHHKLVGKSIRSLKKMFEIIADILNKLFDLKLTGTHVSNKWKSLERSYNIVIDNNNKTERSRNFFEFENEMNDIFAKSKKICPEIVLSSDTKVKFPKTKASVVKDPNSAVLGSQTDSSLEEENENTSDVLKIEKKKRKNNLIEERNKLLKMCLEQGVTLPSNI